MPRSIQVPFLPQQQAKSTSYLPGCVEIPQRRPVTYEPPGGHILAPWIDTCHGMARCERDDLLAVVVEQRIRAHQNADNLAFG